MPRVKKSTAATKKRKKVLKKTKGYRHGRSTKKRQAREALYHAGVHAFSHRRKKKGDFRRLWSVKINAALREHGWTYSKFIDALKKNKIELNRKMLADLAENEPKSFERLVKQIS